MPPTSPRRLPVLLLLFLASGCAALIFEVTWLQLLQLAIGSSAISVSVLLATYMGGLCLGAIAAPRVVCGLSAPSDRSDGRDAPRGRALAQRDAKGCVNGNKSTDR